MTDQVDPQNQIDPAPQGQVDQAQVPTQELKADVQVDTTTVDPAPKSDAPAPATKPKPSWQEQRIAKLAADKAELKRQLDQALAGKASPPPAADFEARVKAEAAAIAAQAEFNRRCDEVADQGRKAFPDFEERISNLVKIADPTDKASQDNYAQFLNFALETGDAARLLHRLGGDLDEAARILSLPPTKQAVELTKLAMNEKVQNALTAQGTTQGAVSALAKPINPIGSKGPVHDPISPSDPVRADKLSTAEWMERREAEVKALVRR